MKNITLFCLVGLILLAACTPATTPLPPSDTPQSTATKPPPSATPEPRPSATLEPSPTPTAPASETPLPSPTPWRPAQPKSACVPNEKRTCQVLFVLPARYYAENARLYPIQFEKAGYSVVMATSYAEVVEVCTESTSDTPSELAIPIDLQLKDVQIADYDAIVYIGGFGCQDQWTDKEALGLAREAVAQGKVLGASGCAPTILAHAGVLEGKKAAICLGDAMVKQGKDYCEVLNSLGATCLDEMIVRDGLIVTSRQRSAYFVAGIIEVIQEITGP
ncbi:MAG: DJ-1/PfpI family protein [Chloroflexota bacterium]